MNPEALRRSLTTSHRTVLLVLASCALISALQEGVVPEPTPDPVLTSLAVGLALGTIVLRRLSTSPVIAPKTSVTLLMGSYAVAAGLGILGAFIAITLGAKQTGLVFALAGGIFCLRSPGRLPGPSGNGEPGSGPQG